MGGGPLQVLESELAEDRFSRFRLISWWDQERIRAAKVVVVGAGALGNEILKNLALLGFERVVIVDIDRIEESNLSRAVLYRDHDVGRFKAEAAADAYRVLYDRATPVALPKNILYEVGLGLFRWADLIIAGLDNREARWWINRCAWKTDRPWIDGAIEGLRGVARVFLPGRPPCYECTLSEVDWQILNRRLSCSLLTREEMQSGKVPTTPTTAAVIAGIEVQEGLKLIHGLPVLQSKGYVFDGVEHTSYVVEYTENSECMSHEVCARVVPIKVPSWEMTLAGLHAAARHELRSNEVVLEFSRDIVHKLVCPPCGAEEELFAPVGTVGAERARCPKCGGPRGVTAIHSFSGAETFGHRKLSDLGLPLWDMFTARSATEEIAFVMDGDEARVLGRPQ